LLLSYPLILGVHGRDLGVFYPVLLGVLDRSFFVPLVTLRGGGFYLPLVLKVVLPPFLREILFIFLPICSGIPRRFFSVPITPFGLPALVLLIIYRNFIRVLLAIAQLVSPNVLCVIRFPLLRSGPMRLFVTSIARGIR